VLAGVVTTVFVGLGYYIGTKDKLSEQNVVLAKDGKAMPWQNEGASDDGDLFKYKVDICSRNKFLTSSITPRGTREMLLDRYVPCLLFYLFFLWIGLTIGSGSVA
jgi:hypothetical protein